MSVSILRADARALPLPSESVDLIITSPPYFALRSYTDAGVHYAGQLGSELTPVEFLDALLECTAEMVRVLKRSGSIWVNLGDKYSGGSGGTSNMAALGDRLGCGGGDKHDAARRRGRAVAGTPPKSLLGLPWRYAIRCVDELGLILRAELIWAKPNGLPESVTDRIRRSHEQWFHFTVQPRYFAAVDEIREGYAPGTAARYAAGYNLRAVDQARPSVNTKLGGDTYGENPLGKLPGSVWEIPSQPLTVPASLGVDHFAAFPMEWPRRIIRGWSPTANCTACGEGRRPVVTSERVASPAHADGSIMGSRRSTGDVRGWDGLPRSNMARQITGYTCACKGSDAPSTPAVVLDPFGGTGTTALVAHALGRHGISVDLSADYCRLAEWRTSDPGQLAAAMRVEKPPVEVPGQASLFGA